MTRDQLVQSLIWALRHGNTHKVGPGAVDVFIPLLDDELRRLVRFQIGREGSEITFQPAVIVNEVGLGFDELYGIEYRARFLAIAAGGVRHILVDIARARVSLERGGDSEVASDEARVSGAWSVDLLALDDALNALAKDDERRSQVAELTVFGGLNTSQITNTIDVAVATVTREWLMARSQLARELERMERWSAGPPRGQRAEESSAHWLKRIIEMKLPYRTHCPACHVQLTVLFDLEARVKPRTEQVWVCPGCGYTDRALFDARIIKVWRGHPTEPCAPTLRRRAGWGLLRPWS